jgi:hypothetical protein
MEKQMRILVSTLMTVTILAALILTGCAQTNTSPTSSGVSAPIIASAPG